MAKAPGATRRLKVYRARLGFEDSVVAAPNQGDALAAWGVRQNLFAEGQAVVETDPEIVAAALDHPGTPLRQPVGAKDGFGLEARAPDTLPPVKRPAASRASASAKAKPPPKPKPDRRELDTAEAELSRLGKERDEEIQELDRRRRRLEDDAAEMERAWRRAREAAERRVAKARRDYERAGG